MRGAIVWGMVRTRNWGLISVEQIVRRLDYLWNETDQSTDEIWKYWHRMATVFTSRHSCYTKTHRPQKIRSQLNIYKQSEDCCLVSWLPDKGCWWCPTRFYICGQIWVQLRFGQIIPSCPQWPVITESKALDKWSAASKVKDYFQGSDATDISLTLNWSPLAFILSCQPEKRWPVNTKIKGPETSTGHNWALSYSFLGYFDNKTT